MTPEEYQQLLASTDAGQLPIARPSFLQGLGQMALPDQPGVDPAQSAAARSQALLTFGLGTLAASQQPGARFGQAVFSGFGQAAKTYGEAADNAFKSNVAKQASEFKQRELDREIKSQARLDKEAARLDRADARKASEDSATTATRLAAGIQAAPDPLQYFGLVKNLPEVQSTLKEYGLDPEALTTPEAIQAAGAHLGQGGSLGLPYQKPEALQLRAIIGPDGKPILVPEDKAINKTPFEKSGMRVSLPDGTTISEGGPEPINPSELTKPVVTNLQESIVNSTSGLDRLDQSLASFNPEYLRLKGLAKVNVTRFKDFVGLDVSPDEKQFLNGYSKNAADLSSDLSSRIFELSGKAATDKEVKRIQEQIPSGKEYSPEEFYAKASAARRQYTRIIMRANYALRNGIGTKSVEDLSRAVPLESIERIYEDRLNQIFDDLGGTPEAKKKAVEQAQQEFGLARQ